MPKKLTRQVAELCEGAKLHHVVETTCMLVANVTEHLDEQGKLDFARVLLSGIFDAEVTLSSHEAPSNLH